MWFVFFQVCVNTGAALPQSCYCRVQAAGIGRGDFPTGEKYKTTKVTKTKPTSLYRLYMKRIHKLIYFFKGFNKYTFKE